MTRGKTAAQIVLTIIFLGTLAVFFFGTLLSKKDDVSQQEKRQLSRFPEFSWTTSSLMDFPKSLDAYLMDHFFHREDLVFLNALPRVKLLHRSPSFVVLVGKEGWYFYIGEWALHDYLGSFDKRDDILRSWEKLIALRQQKLQKMGCNYLVAVAPNKESVYPEFLPGSLDGTKGITMLDALKKQMRDSPMANHFLDLGDPLRQAKATGQVYFKTDTHWNGRGAYFAYRAIIERIRHWYPEIVPLPEERFNHPLEKNSSGGDLVSVMGLKGAIPENGEGWLNKKPCAKPQDKTIISESFPDGKFVQTNGCPAGAALRMLVISDSFGNGLRDYLSETFQNVVYSTELGLSDLQNFITKYKPDIVLDLRVGRYLPRVMSPGPDEKTDD